MRDLKRSLLLLGLLMLAAATLAFSTARSSAADSSRHVALQAANVELSLSIDPIAIEPGEQATVHIILKNHSPGPLAPEVELALPPSVSTRLQDLPTATIFNAQRGTIGWQPVLAPDGGEALLSLPIVAKVADVHAPKQIISAIVRNGEQEVSQDINFWIGIGPTAKVRLNPTQVSVGQPIQLVGEVAGPEPIAQIWALGDGRIVEAQNPVVVYPSPGTYEVTLQASSPLGVMTANSTVTVVGQTVARFSLADETPVVGQQLSLTNESGGQQPLTFFWDFGDGLTSTEANPVHSYAAPGPYEIRLVVSGPGGESETTESVLVGDAPIADFVIEDVVDAGTTLSGQAFTDATITSISWDMGDGQSYEGESIQHVYWSAGDYIVTLTVANEYGETRLQRMVRVNPGNLYLFLPVVLNGSLQETPIREQGQQLDSPAPLEAPSDVEIEELAPIDLEETLSPAEQLLAYVNEARRINGRSALTPVAELNAAAQKHAGDMANNNIIGHTGSDGTVPALRVQLSGYPGGYAGEATAWGMLEAIEPVRYWLESPAHRDIILNPAATEIGVGFSENYNSDNVWYWTAEFASPNLPVVRVALPTPEAGPPPDPTIELLGPPREGAFLLSADTNLIFTWSWPVPLLPDERFAVYLNARGRITQLGTVNQPQSENQFSFKISAGNVPASPGAYSWHVRLEDTLKGTMRSESASWPINFLSEQADSSD